MTSSLPKFAGNLFGLDLTGLFEDSETGGLPEGFMPQFNFTANVKGRSPSTLTYKTPKTPSGTVEFSLASELPDIVNRPAEPAAPAPAAPAAPAAPTYAPQYQSIFEGVATPTYARALPQQTQAPAVPVAAPPSTPGETQPPTSQPEAAPTYGSGLKGQIRSAGSVLSKKEATRIAGATGKTVAQVMSKAQDLGTNFGSGLVNAYSKGNLGPNAASPYGGPNVTGTLKAIESLAPLTNLQLPKNTVYAGSSVYNIPATSTRSVNAGYSSTPAQTIYNPIVIPREPSKAQTTNIQKFNEGGSAFGAAAINRALSSGLSSQEVRKAAAAQGVDLTKKAKKALKK